MSYFRCAIVKFRCSSPLFWWSYSIISSTCCTAKDCECVCIIHKKNQLFICFVIILMSFLLLFLLFQFPTTGPVLTQQPTHVVYSSGVNRKKIERMFIISLVITFVVTVCLCWSVLICSIPALICSILVSINQPFSYTHENYSFLSFFILL